MESSTVGDWDAQWTTHQLAGPTTWLEAYGAGGDDVAAVAGIFEPAQQQLVEGNAVDQLLLERIMADFAANTDNDPSGQTFDLDCLLSTTTATTSTTAETSPDPADDSGSYPQPIWKQAPGSGLSSSCNNKKRKRDPNPEQFRLVGSEYDYPSSGFKLIREPGKPPSNISFQPSGADADAEVEPDAEAIQQMKEMIYRAAAFRPVNLGEEPAEKPRRKNVRISSDPQTVAARQRRERISERLRVLQKLVPGGSKMDTASMLDEAANYLKFLRTQVKALEAVGARLGSAGGGGGSSSTSCSLANGVLPSVSLDFSSFGGGFSMVPANYSMQLQSHHRQNPSANPLLLLQQYAKS